MGQQMLKMSEQQIFECDLYLQSQAKSTSTQEDTYALLAQGKRPDAISPDLFTPVSQAYRWTVQRYASRTMVLPLA